MARQLERFDNLVSLFLTRAAEKRDAPFLWASSDPSPVTVSDVLVQLPSHERPDGGEIVAPAFRPTTGPGRISQRGAAS